MEDRISELLKEGVTRLRELMPEAALQCWLQVLALDPGNERARFYLRATEKQLKALGEVDEDADTIRPPAREKRPAIEPAVNTMEVQEVQIVGAKGLPPSPPPGKVKPKRKLRRDATVEVDPLQIVEEQPDED